ncbi:MAG: hypothetical protein K5766_04880 [Alphaproteobacteria bacterium]|nr:hypothetical protein [Alphaproteobacteria bacterium]
MKLNFKILYSAAVLCFAGSVFATNSNPLKNSSPDGEVRLIPIKEHEGFVPSKESPIDILNSHCKAHGLSLKFEYGVLSGKEWNCTVIINDKKYKIDFQKCENKEAAKCETAENVCKILGLSAQDRLGKYFQNNKIPAKLSDVVFLYDINKDGTFICKIKIKDKVYERNMGSKGKKDAKNQIIERYMYEMTKELSSQDSSSKES